MVRKHNNRLRGVGRNSGSRIISLNFDILTLIEPQLLPTNVAAPFLRTVITCTNLKLRGTKRLHTTPRR